MYLVFRILMLDGLSWKERVQRFLLGCLEMILGVGMSLVVFLPMAEVLLNVSSRLDSDGTGLLDFLRQSLHRIRVSFICPCSKECSQATYRMVMDWQRDLSSM